MANILTYVFPAATKANMTAAIKGVFFPMPYFLNYNDPKLREAIVATEGYKLTVYRDSRGLPTVGIGHLVTLGDRLKVGDTITAERAEQLYIADIKKAVRAANEQAQELIINDPNFLIALAEVNYQLGTYWRSKFPRTWEYLKKGWQGNAINNIKKSAWISQTPNRANNFINAIRENFA